MPIIDVNKFIKFKEKPTTFGSVPLPNTSQKRAFEMVNKKIFGVANPMRPKQPAQKAIPDKPDKDHIKDSTGNKNNGSNGGSAEWWEKYKDIDPFQYAAAGLFGAPGALSQFLMGSQKGDTEASGGSLSGLTEKQLNTIIETKLKNNGGVSNGGGNISDPFKGSLKGLGEGLNLATAAIPLLIGVMLLTQIKGLFK